MLLARTMMRTDMARFIATLLLTLTIGACGLKGDLYIPPEPEAPAAAEAAPATDTVAEPSTPEPAAEKAPVEEEVTDE